MAGAEGVVAVDIGHVGQRLGEARIPLLLAGIKAQVLHDQHLAADQLLGFRLGVVTHRVGGERDFLLSSSPSRTAVGRMLYFAASLGPPWAAPGDSSGSVRRRVSTDSMDGKAIRIRVSSVMLCLSSRGTLKSTRISTFLFLTSTS